VGHIVIVSYMMDALRESLTAVSNISWRRGVFSGMGNPPNPTRRDPTRIVIRSHSTGNQVLASSQLQVFKPPPSPHLRSSHAPKPSHPRPPTDSPLPNLQNPPFPLAAQISDRHRPKWQHLLGVPRPHCRPPAAPRRFLPRQIPRLGRLRRRRFPVCFPLRLT
jgi:hypothetical protein